MPIDIEEYPLYQDGFQDGRERGRTEGLERGRTEGHTEFLLEALRSRFPEINPKDEADVRALDETSGRALARLTGELASVDALRDWLRAPQ